MGRWAFEPGWVPTVAAAGLVGLTLWLGNWQLNRAEEKRGRQAMLESRSNDNPVALSGAVPSADPLMYRRVTATGRWVGERQIFVDNQIRDGRAGFSVVTPFAIEGGAGATVLVNRGWIARSADYPAPPRVEVPPGRVSIAGFATRPPARFIEFSEPPAGSQVVQNLSIERVRAQTGLALLPVLVLLEHPPAAGLVAVTETPNAGISKHLEYAFTWFALAATASALWLGLNVRRTG